MQDPIPGAGQFKPWVSLSVDYDPELFRAEIRANPNSERIRWFKSRLSPTASRSKGVQSKDGKLYDYVEQTVLRQTRAKIEDERIVKNYIQSGEVQSGDIAVTVMLDEIPLADHDIIIPIGRYDGNYPAVDARVFPFSDLYTRGKDTIKLAGTISSSGTTVTGTGTQFTTQLIPGDLIVVGSGSAVVKTISSDTSLTIVTAPNCVYSQQSFSIASEDFQNYPAAYIDEIVDANNVVYNNVTDVAVSADGKSIQWINPLNQPAFGVNFTVRYYYYPVYIIIPDYGTRRHVVKGKSMPMTVIARLVTPQTYNNLF